MRPLAETPGARIDRRRVRDGAFDVQGYGGGLGEREVDAGEVPQAVAVRAERGQQRPVPGKWRAARDAKALESRRRRVQVKARRCEHASANDQLDLVVPVADWLAVQGPVPEVDRLRTAGRRVDPAQRLSAEVRQADAEEKRAADLSGDRQWPGRGGEGARRDLDRGTSRDRSKDERAHQENDRPHAETLA